MFLDPPSSVRVAFALESMPSIGDRIRALLRILFWPDETTYLRTVGQPILQKPVLHLLFSRMYVCIDHELLKMQPWESLSNQSCRHFSSIQTLKSCLCPKEPSFCSNRRSSVSFSIKIVPSLRLGSPWRAPIIPGSWRSW
jgi:hypothetical protein